MNTEFQWTHNLWDSSETKKGQLYNLLDPVQNVRLSSLFKVSILTFITELTGTLIVPSLAFHLNQSLFPNTEIKQKHFKKHKWPRDPLVFFLALVNSISQVCTLKTMTWKEEKQRKMIFYYSTLWKILHCIPSTVLFNKIEICSMTKFLPIKPYSTMAISNKYAEFFYCSFWKVILLKLY